MKNLYFNEIAMLFEEKIWGHNTWALILLAPGTSIHSSCLDYQIWQEQEDVLDFYTYDCEWLIDTENPMDSDHIYLQLLKIITKNPQGID